VRISPVIVSGLLALSLAAAAAPQMSEAEMSEALDRIGDLLGLPPVSPDELKRRVANVESFRFRRTSP
jgi:hypothetical protein